MLLSILNLFREKLPCSENFWRYKRNFEKKACQGLKIDIGAEGRSEDSNPGYKEYASPVMKKLRPLSPYTQGNNFNLRSFEGQDNNADEESKVLEFEPNKLPASGSLLKDTKEGGNKIVVPENGPASPGATDGVRNFNFENPSLLATATNEAS